MIQVINRAFDILEFIGYTSESTKTLGEVKEHLGLNAATCANIIKTLVDRKYLEKLDKKGGYRLGIMAYMLTKNYNYAAPLVSASKHEIELLSKKLNENCLCAILRDNSRIVLVKAQSNHALQANTFTEKHAYNSSSGRLLVAMLSDEELDKFVQLYGASGREFWKGSEHKETFMREISQIRKDGFAIQLTERGIVGIAIPIYSANHVIASLSVYLPSIRFNKERKTEILRSMQFTTKKIQKNLSKNIGG